MNTRGELQPARSHAVFACMSVLVDICEQKHLLLNYALTLRVRNEIFVLEGRSITNYK